MLTETTSILGLSRLSFVESTLIHTVPYLVLRRNRPALEKIAGTLGKNLGVLIIQHPQLLSHIFKVIFMQYDTDKVPQVLGWLVETLQQHLAKEYPLSINSLINQCQVDLIVEVIIDLGDPDTENKAETALERIFSQLENANGSRRSEAWLKKHMLGIITGISDTIQDLRGRKTAEEKAKVLRSLDGLIHRVGFTMAGFSSQVS